jgi:hypothetical protein
LSRAIPSAEPARFPVLEAVSVFSIGAALLAAQSALTTVDPDVFHEMALFRAARQLGHIPDRDLFAYTPTVTPCVHHEWATGMILDAVAMSAGGGGIMLLKYCLTTAIAGVCVLCARRRETGLAMLTIGSLVGISLARIGFTTIRAQVFTLLALAILLLLLDQDRQGKRGWIAWWLPVYVLWLNFHGGFVVGMGVVGIHWLEQVIRRRTPQWHLVLTLLAMAALIVVNPYGLRYYPYLWHALTMPRPLIPEWAPLWHDPQANLLSPYVLSLALLAYPLFTVGPRGLPGLSIVLACAVLAAQHTRHLGLYAIAWWCYAPSFLQQTAAANWLDTFWERQRTFVVVTLGLLGVLCLALALPRRPWQLVVPTTTEGPTAGKIIYPAGAVRYLQEQQFHGNLLTPFVEGAYVSWHLDREVKVSMDSRYEVAYVPGLLEEQIAFYDAADGWRQTLTRYPTDAVLVRLGEPVAARLDPDACWKRVYQDDSYAIHVRPGLSLPVVHRKGHKIIGSFP